MKNDMPTFPNCPKTDFTLALKALETNLRMAESDLAFELAMLELEGLIELVESLEWP